MAEDRSTRQGVIAVTGANGFVGQHLCRALEQCGYTVRRLVRSNDASLPDAMAVGEIGAFTDWIPALTGVNCVIHCAARVHIMQASGLDQLPAFRQVNVLGTRRLAEHAVQAKVERLIFLSSIKVHGEETQPGIPFAYTDTVRPADAYAVSKWEAEEALRNIAQQTGLQWVVVRLPLVYGSGVQGNFLRLMKLVQHSIPFPLGRVRNYRSLLSVYNLTDLLIRCIHHPNAVGQTLLASDDQDISTPELILRLARAMRKAAYLLPVPVCLLTWIAWLAGRSIELRRLTSSLQVDIRHTCTTLDWAPPISVEKSLEITISGTDFASDC